MDFKNLRTIRQLAEEAKDTGSFLTEGKLRWWVYNADKNGLRAVIVRVGGRIFLDKEAFNQWLESLKGNQRILVAPAQPQKLVFEDK